MLLAVLLMLAAAMPTRTKAQSAEIARFVGTYDAVRPGANGNNALELVLFPGGGAKLTTTPSITQSASGKPVWPVVERGTWSVAEGSAFVHFTLAVNIVDRKPADRHTEEVVLVFDLSGCTLKLVHDHSNVYGNSGLRMRKRKC